MWGAVDSARLQMWKHESSMYVWEEAEIIILMTSIAVKWLIDLWSYKLQEIVKFIQAKFPRKPDSQLEYKAGALSLSFDH